MEEIESSVGRDAQLHLFVAALLRASELTVTLDEPDTRFEIDGEYWGIAVKRCKSPKRLVDLVRDGCRQVHTQVREGRIKNGAIYVDVSRAWNPTGEFVEPMPDDIFNERHAAALRIVVDRVHHELQRQMEGKYVSAVFILDSQVRMLGGWNVRFETCEMRVQRTNGGRRPFLLAERLGEVLSYGWAAAKKAMEQHP